MLQLRGISIALAITLCAVACDSSTTPAPAPFQITGVVSTLGGAPLSGIGVSVLDGVNVGRTTVTNDNGAYALTNLSGGPYTLQAIGSGFLTLRKDGTLSSDVVVNFQLSPVLLGN